MKKIGKIVLSVFLYYMLFGFCMACLVGGLNFQEKISAVISIGVVIIVFLLIRTFKFLAKNKEGNDTWIEKELRINNINSNHSSFYYDDFDADQNDRLTIKAVDRLGENEFEVKDAELSSDYYDGLASNKKDRLTIESFDGMEGKEFEDQCAELLRKNGFVNVRTTKTSGDQGVDILAEKDGIKYAVQCKCYSLDLGNKPIQEVFAGKAIYKCHVACVLTNRYFTSGGIEASKATGVLLWDRIKLQEFIENANKN